MCENCETEDLCQECEAHHALLQSVIDGQRAWDNEVVMCVVEYFHHLADDLLLTVDDSKASSLFPDLAENTADGMRLMAGALLTQGLMMHMAGQHARARISRSN